MTKNSLFTGTFYLFYTLRFRFHFLRLIKGIHRAKLIDRCSLTDR